MTTSMKKNQSLRANAIAVAVIMAASIAVTLPSLNGEFLNWDDNRFVVNNPHVSTLSLENAGWAFEEVRFELYQPLFLVSFMIDGSLWPSNATGYRLHNLGLHLISLVMLFFLLRRMHIGVIPAVIGCLFFALAPSRVESTAWISSRKDVLMLLFSLMAWHLHLSAAGTRPKTVAFRILSVAAMAAALLSKSGAVAIPAMILVSDIGLRQIPLRKALAATAPLAIPVIAVSVAVPFLWSQVDLIRDPVAPGITGRLMLVGWTLAHYLKVALWPFHLSPLYAEPTEAALATGASVGAGFILVCCAALLIARRAGRRISAPTVALLWFLAGIAPFLNIIPLYYLVADRYLLLPSLGIALATALLAGVVLSLKKSRYRIMLGVAVTAILFSWSAASWSENAAWRDSLSLWEHATGRQPDAFFARLKFGETLRETGSPSESADQYREAMRIRPLSPTALAGLFWGELLADEGAAALKSGDDERAVGRFLSIADNGPELFRFSRRLASMRLHGAARVVMDRFHELTGKKPHPKT